MSRKNARLYYQRHPEKAKKARRQYSEKRKDKTAIYNAEYRAAHKAELDAYMKVWHAKNKDAVAAQGKQHYEANRTRLLAEKREYYIKNRAVIRAKKKANREPARRSEDLRRARKAGASVGDLQLIAAWEKRWRKKPFVICYWCRNEIRPASLARRDHVIPLAKGGAHEVGNLCLSCDSCNCHKHARTLDKWNATLAQPVLL